MSYPADPHAAATGPRPLAGWAGPHSGGRPETGDGDDGLVHLAGLILGFLVAVLLATAAVVAGLAAYGLITWRRTRWWPTVLLGAVLAVLAVAALGGPGPAIHHHLLAARELTAPRPTGLAHLIAHRWAAWALAQLPLSVPLGLVAAGLARHRVTHLPAPELSPSAQARRAAEHQAQLRRAQRKAASAPLEAHGQKVLGAWVAGDLTAWRAGEWCTIPDGTLGLGTVVLGLPGAGKTETLLRLAEVGLAGGSDVHVIDAKGDAATQARFAAIAQRFGHQPKLFPQESYDGWRGDPTALRNRLGRIVDYTEPYYQDGARLLLDHATRQQPASLEEFLADLADNDVDVDNQVRKGTLSRYRSFSAAAGPRLSGGWAFEDTHASYVLLDGVALGDDTPRLARYLLEDFQHYAATRKPADRRVLLIVDEFSALRVTGAAALLERLRSFGCGVVVAAQSVEGLHDDPNERARLLGAASTVIAHRLADPELVAARAGTTKRAERSHQLDHHGATGMGSLRIQETYRIDPNDLRNLPAGVAWITTAGRAAKVCVSQAQDEAGVLKAPLGRASQNDRTNSELRLRGTTGVGLACVVTDGPDEISIIEARLVSAQDTDDGFGPIAQQRRPARPPTPRFEQQPLPIDGPAGPPSSDDRPPSPPEELIIETPVPETSPEARLSPYVEGL